MVEFISLPRFEKSQFETISWKGLMNGSLVLRIATGHLFELSIIYFYFDNI